MHLPANASQHGFTSKGRGIDINPSSSLLMFKKEVRETELNESKDVLVTHRYVLVER